MHGEQSALYTTHLHACRSTHRLILYATLLCCRMPPPPFPMRQICLRPGRQVLKICVLGLLCVLQVTGPHPSPPPSSVLRPSHPPRRHRSWSARCCRRLVLALRCPLAQLTARSTCVLLQTADRHPVASASGPPPTATMQETPSPYLPIPSSGSGNSFGRQPSYTGAMNDVAPTGASALSAMMRNNG